MKKKLAINFLIENLQEDSSLKIINEKLTETDNNTETLKKNLLKQIEDVQRAKTHQKINSRKLELQNDILNFQSLKGGFAFQNSIYGQFGFHKKEKVEGGLEDSDEELFLLETQTKRLKEGRK